MRPLASTPALLLLALLAAPPAGATGCPEPTGASPSLRRVEAEARLSFIQERLRHDAARAHVWTGAWTGGYALMSVGQLAVTPFLSPADRVDFYVGAASTVGAAAAVLAVPLDVMTDSPALDARIGSKAGPDTCAVLAEAERLLAKDAANEADSAGWMMQAANLSYNLAIGLVLGLVFKHWESGAINAGAGWLIGEAMILTQPTHLVDDLRRYREGQLEPERTPVSFQIGPSLGSRGFGLSLTLSF